MRDIWWLFHHSRNCQTALQGGPIGFPSRACDFYRESAIQRRVGGGNGGRGTESGCRDQRPDCCPRGREAATLLAHPAQVRRPQRPQGARSACARNSGRQSHHRSCLLFRLPWMGSVLQITTAIIFMIRKIRSGEKRKETESPMVQGTCRSKPAASGLRCPLFVLHLRTHRRKWGARTSVQARSPALLGRGQEATST